MSLIARTPLAAVLRTLVAGPGPPCGATGLQRADPLAELPVLLRQLTAARAQARIVLPPVDTDLPRLVHGRYEQPDLDGEQFDVEEVHADVARDHDALVEDPLEDVGEAARLRSALGGPPAARHGHPSGGHRPRPRGVVDAVLPSGRSPPAASRAAGAPRILPAPGAA